MFEAMVARVRPAPCPPPSSTSSVTQPWYSMFTSRLKAVDVSKGPAAEPRTSAMRFVAETGPAPRTTVSLFVA